MKTLQWILALLAGATVGAAVTAWLARPAVAPPPNTGVGAAAEQKVLYWYDPMVPTQHFDQPGKSPFMDMQLVPKYADASRGGEGSVRIDARLVQNLGLRTAKATRGTLQRVVRASGNVAFDERAVALVQARVAGIVERLAVRAPLSAVRQGQPLLTLIAPEWTAAQAEYLSLRQSRNSALDALQAAARQRLLLLGMSEAQIAAIERSGQAQTRITLTAPRSGVVSELLVREGASVTAAMPLLRINGLDTVWIDAAIAEAQLAHVAAGDAVRIELPAFPGETLHGRIEALLPALDATTRTQTARIVVANPAQRLVPGMFARLTLAAAATSPDTVLVPSEAVIATGTRHVVIVDTGDGHFRAQEIRVGAEDDSSTVVLQGLAAGDTVVVSAQFLIDSEASLAGTLARLGDAPPQSDTDTAAGDHAETDADAQPAQGEQP